MTSQPKSHSLAEALANVVFGYGVMVVAQWVIFPRFGVQVETVTNLKIGGCFTVVSVVRSYVFRRAFNWVLTQPQSRQV